MTDKQVDAKAIVQRAIHDLVTLGMEPETAASLLAVQGLIRMPSVESRRELLHLIDSDQFEDPAARSADGEGD